MTTAFAIRFLLLAGGAAVLIALLMLLVWVLSERLKNAGIVDIAWSAWFPLLAILYGLFGDGAVTKRFAIALIVSIWGLRLALHLARRVYREHPQEDRRYAALREKWGAAAPRRMLVFYQQQGIANILLSLPFLLVALDADPHWSVIARIGLVVWAAGVVGEAIADAQLERFKRQPENRGRTMQTGLWRYSRHPNYFCEWLIWCGFYLVACGSPFGWVTFYAPLGMLHLLLNVTGVPMAEEQSLKSRGDEYRRYQQTTSKFFPWFPKKGATR